MRNWGVLFVLLVLVLALTACGGSNSATQGEEGEGGQQLASELKVFNWAEYLPDEVIKRFEEEFGVRVIYDPFSSNAEMLTKLQSGAVEYDIVVPTDYIVARMIKQEMLHELDMDNIPNFKHIDQLFQERGFDPGNKYSVPYLYGSIGLVYDKTKVDNPTGWKDLWNADYASHVLLSSVGRETVSVALQMLGYSQNDVSDSNLEEAKEALLELHPRVFTYSSLPADILSGNDVWIAAAYSGEAGRAMRNNENLMFIIPEEGGTLWMDNLAIPKVSQNKYTAEVFINFLLEPEISKMITDAIPYSNPNSSAVELMSAEEKNNPAMYPPTESLKNAEWFEDLGPELPKVDRVWREVLGN